MGELQPHPLFPRQTRWEIPFLLNYNEYLYFTIDSVNFHDTHSEAILKSDDWLDIFWAPPFA